MNEKQRKLRRDIGGDVRDEDLRMRQRIWEEGDHMREKNGRRD